MPNNIKATTVPVYYQVDQSGVTIQLLKLEVGTELVDNASDLTDTNFAPRNTPNDLEDYIIQNRVDINGFDIPDQTPLTRNNRTRFTGLNANQVETVVKRYLRYFESNTPTDDFTLDLRGTGNARIPDARNNRTIIDITGVFDTAGYVITILMN